MRCLLIGNYGVGNVGDEALREYFLATFSDVQWTVLGVDTPRLPFGLRSLFTRWGKTVALMMRCDAVVFGGGSLFTDSESVFACFLWWWHGIVARVFRKPVFLAFQGVGPFRTGISSRLTKSIFKRASFISVRDEASLRRIADWKLCSQPLLTFDPAFAVFSTRKPIRHSKKILAIIPRSNADDQFFVTVSGEIKKPFDEVRILLMQPDDCERAIAARIQAMTTMHSSVIEMLSADQLLEEISGADHVLSQRYHGALAALAMGVDCTVVPQVSGDKLSELRSLQASTEKLARCLTLVRQGEEGMREALRRVEK